MLENQVIMRTYKEIKKNEYKQINIQKEYENDNYLIQTLKRTSKCNLEKKIYDYQKEVKNLLDYIYKETQLQNDPKIKKIKDENNIFQKEYNSISENFQKLTKIIFKELFRKYNQRGYKLPKLSYQHNLFKINALIEENQDKIELILKEDKHKNKNGTIAFKTMAYLKKLSFLLNLLLSKDENKAKKIAKFFQPKHNIKPKNDDTIEKLKDSIENLKLIIKEESLNYENIQSLKNRRKSSSNKFHNFNTIKLIKPKKSNLEFNDSNINTINNTQIESEQSRLIFERKDKANPSNFLSIKQKSNTSSKSNLSEEIKKEESASSKKIEEILYSSPISNNIIFNNNNFLPRNSKQLIKLKTPSMNIYKKEKSNSLSILNNIINEENEKKKDATNFNRKSHYLNTFTNYKNKQPYNNRYLSNKIKIQSISLKKSSNILQKYTSEKLKSNKKYNFIRNHDSLKNQKTQKLKTTFFVKTQTLDKKNLSRNNNFFYSQSKNDNSSTNKIIMSSESKTQDDYLLTTYNRLKKGNYNKIEEIMRKYLKDIKHLEPNEEDFVISHYNFKNLKTNLTELAGKMEKNDLGKKTERIYSINHLTKRIFPLLKKMREKENNIYRFEKIVSSGAKNYK